jgi:hypothetical protein
MLDVKIDSTDAERGLANLAARLKRTRPFIKTWAGRVARLARMNARAKGGRSFWRELADRTAVTMVSDDSAIVYNDHPVAAHKQFGGTIRPKNRRALTIPISDEAKGKTAGEFAAGGRDLFVLPSDKADTIGILGYDEPGVGFHPLFVLRTKVTQKPDPWFPTVPEIEGIGIGEALWWLDRELRAAGRGI